MNSIVVARSAAALAEASELLVSAGVECVQSRLLNATETSDATTFADCDVAFVGLADTGDDHAARLISEVRRATRGQVVAIGCFRDAAQILRLVRAGASDCLHTGLDFVTECRALCDRLGGASQDQQALALGKLFCVVGAAGGCGVSTIAANLSASLARRHAATLLVDLKLRGGDLAIMLGLRPPHTLAELCSHGDELDGEMLQKSLGLHNTGVRLLAGPAPLEDYGPIDWIAVDRVLQLASQMFEHVVIDLEDVFHREQLAAIRRCDALLIVLRLELHCMVRARRLLSFLEMEGIDMSKVKLVANHFGEKNQFAQNKVITALGRPITFYLPHDYASAAMALNLGNPLVAEFPTAKLSRAINEMSETLAQSLTTGSRS